MTNTVQTSSDYQIVPCSEAPSQSISITLNGQATTINLYTKSINVPIQPPGSIPSDPDPQYQNTNPVFMDIYLNGVLLVGGVIARNGGLIIRNTYFGYKGDFAIIDTQGSDDPQGVSYRLPPYYLRNDFELSIPLSDRGIAPPNIANKIPGLGTRFLLTYWPNLP